MYFNLQVLSLEISFYCNEYGWLISGLDSVPAMQLLFFQPLDEYFLTEWKSNNKIIVTYDNPKIDMTIFLLCSEGKTGQCFQN